MALKSRWILFEPGNGIAQGFVQWARRISKPAFSLFTADMGVAVQCAQGCAGKYLFLAAAGGN